MAQDQKPLLQPGITDETAASAGFRPVERSRNWRDISNAFRRAAENLTDDGRLHGTISDLPIVFLYRHAIETAVKTVLLMEKGKTRNKNGEVRVLARGHDLEKQLCDICLLAKRLKNKPTVLIELVKRWMAEDRDSMTARYPSDKIDGQISFKNETNFDLQAFVGECDAAFNELESMIHQLDRQELEATSSGPIEIRCTGKA